VLFHPFDVTRTCPVCSGTLKAYVDEPGEHLLACLSCTWAMATKALASAVVRQLLDDRNEQAQLDRAFDAAMKGGA
jgi:hypothetical protein